MTPVQGKGWHRLVVGAWLVALVLGMMVPVYSDEVGWRLQARAGLDGIDKLYSEQCGPSTLARPLWFMWPVRWYSAFFNLALPDPFWVRASGVAYALVWAGLLLWLIAAMIPDRARRASAGMLVVGLLGLGTLPLQLVWSRPEQPILLCATAALLIAWQGWRASMPEGRKPQGWLRVAGILALALIALSYHFKALVLIPLFATCLLACDRQRGTRAVRILSLPVLGVLSWQAAQYWFGRLSCPGDPVLAAQHASQSLLLGGKAGLGAALWAVLGNYNLPIYVMRAAPNVTPMSNWLHPHLVSKAQQIAWSAGMILLWLAGFVTAMGAAITAGRAAWQRRALDLRLVFAVVLFGTASVWCVGQKVRNSYEAAFVLPLLALAYVCALGAAEAGAPRQTGAIARLTGWAMLISLILVGGIYGPSLAQAARHPGYVAGQPLSVSVADYPRARAEIIAAARQCGIGPESHPQRLLLDDLTYFAFMRSPQPDHHLAVLDAKWNGAVGANPLPYLRSIHAGGMVVGCQFLSPALRQKAHERGGYCCMSGLDWGL